MRQSERLYQVNEASHGSSGIHDSGIKSPGSFSNERQYAAIAEIRPPCSGLRFAPRFRWDPRS
jgi:hypothetical protein